MPRKESSGGKEAKDVDKESVTKSGDATTLPYSLNDKVLCRHLDNLYYEAKIIAVEQTPDGELIYTVHYQGWNQRHDEKIRHSVISERFLEYTPANVERAKAEMRDAQARIQLSKKKGKKSSGGLEDKRNEGSESRASTPSEKRGASSSRAASITSDRGAYGVSTAASIASTSSRKRRSAAAGSEAERIPDFVRKEEIKIEMPMVLKDILVDDQDMIVRQMYLVRIPARYTVAEIIRQYADYTGTSVEARDQLKLEYTDETQLKSMMVTLIESSLGVQDYFNTALGTQLLYKFERPQYLDLVNEHTTKKESIKEEQSTKRKRVSDVPTTEEGATVEETFKPSDFYGFIHLLRLFVRFGSMLSLTSWSDRALQSIVSHVHNFLKFLEVNRHKFFDIETDYEVASPEYQRRVWTT
uniref:Chromo domain-containing protein n=1 Tax=Parascaris univalens TaxID=6257 RepID=A0A915CDV5_PARUN